MSSSCCASKTCNSAGTAAAAAAAAAATTVEETKVGSSSGACCKSSGHCDAKEKRTTTVREMNNKNNNSDHHHSHKNGHQHAGHGGGCSSKTNQETTTTPTTNNNNSAPPEKKEAMSQHGGGGGGGAGCCSSGKCSSGKGGKGGGKGGGDVGGGGNVLSLSPTATAAANEDHHSHHHSHHHQHSQHHHCSHDHHDHNHAEDVKEDDDEDDGEDDEDPICLAVVREDGTDIVLFDAKGIPRTFWYPTTTTTTTSNSSNNNSGNENNNSNAVVVAGDIRRLCFSTHGLVKSDEIMTHCLNDQGHHGTPDEWCMCGVDTPHLHAHLHNPETCGHGDGCEEEDSEAAPGKKSNKVKKATSKFNVAAMSLEERFHFLATHILHPKDDDDDDEKDQKLDIAVSERMPKECNSEHFSSASGGFLNSSMNHNNKKSSRIAKFQVRHDDHDDVLVHDKQNSSLYLQHENCGDCGRVDVHGKFRSVARRRWKRRNSSDDDKHIQIHFFDIAPDRPFRFLDHLVDNLFSLDSDRVRAATAQPSPSSSPYHGHHHHALVEEKSTPPKKKTKQPQDDNDDDDATEATADVVAMVTPAAVVVRSTFHCARICCASEIPVIKKALATLGGHDGGIENILVNVPLKQVLVDHCPSLCTAQQVVKALNRYHLGAAIQRDGGAVAAQASAATTTSTSTMGRSQFYVSNICCASEIPMINGIVQPLVTVKKVSINVTTKMVYVDHDYQQLSANDILSALNQEAFGAELRVDAAHMAARHAATSRSLFVTSQFTFTTDQEVNHNAAATDVDAAGISVDELKTFLQAYDATQVECFVVDEPTKTITVIHNPNTLTATEVYQGLATKTSIHATILTDGGTSTAANQGFDYDAAARMQDHDEDAAAATTDFKRFTWPKPTVILSGVFWLISMLALIGGNFEYLKYVGVISVAFGLPPIALKAFRTMRRIQFDTNCLMFFASVGALALGEFEEAAAVVFLFALSEWLEVRATTRARQALSAIVNLRPDKANLVHPETQELIVVPASIVPVGALVSVRTGDKIPCDGVVVEGASTVDESSLTGESRPIRKGPQDKVSGGTVNSGETQLLVRTISTAENSAVSRLIRLVEEAQANRSETEQLVDEFAKFYTPVVVLAALLMCTIPWAFGPELGRQWTNNGLVLIVVACPCALIISTPVSYVAGLATTAQKGILIKGGAYLESLGMVKHVCFDKTGTLTNGEFALLHLEEWVNSSEDADSGIKSNRTEVLQHLALMESRAAHPVAQAILAGTRNEGVLIPSDMKLQKHTIIAGEGVAGVINGLDVHVGNERLFERLGLLDKVPAKILDSVASWKHLGGTIGFMSIEGRGIVCAYCAADAIRPEAARVVAKLKQRGIQVSMLTGDNDDAAQTIGKQLGLGPEQIRSKLLPEEKLAYIERLGEDGHLGRSALFGFCAPSDIVLFCGDGVNDAPAIAAANVGVAMGAGAALAMETADVTLLDSDLEKLFYSMDMGRRVIRKIWENIIFSISVKFLVLGFALAGKTQLWAAIASDVGAMILVTLNSMMLMPVRRGGQSHGATLDTKKIGDVENGQGAKRSPSFDVAKSSCAKGCCGDRAPANPQACTTAEKQGSCCSVPKSHEHAADDGCCNEGKSHSHTHGKKESGHGCCGGVNSDEHSEEFSF